MVGAMRFSWIFTATILLVLIIGVKCKRKFDGDFEFAEEDDTRIMKVGDKKRWIHDPNSELCRPLNCKKKELCLLENMFTAVCVSKKELHKSGDIVIQKSRAIQQRRMKTEVSIDSDDDDAFFDSEDDDDDQDESKCQECPVVKPTFLCGNDNRTYSSPCRLEYHNCIHHTSVHIACKGFCPCKVADLRLYSKKMQMQRKKTLMGKMGHNHDITFMPRDFNYDNHHYQYLKYTKRGKDLAIANKYDDKHLSNKVTDKPQSPFKAIYNVQLPSRNTDCPSSSKPAMANRLLDWFSVVMMDSKHRRLHLKSKSHFPIGCQSEVRWMFGHLDSDSDSRLSLSELYGLEHDQNEPCLKPFLDGCDTDSPVPWRALTKSERCQASWLIGHHHGLQWEDGNVPYSFARRLITRAVMGAAEEEDGVSPIVYVKGHEKREWLADILNDDARNDVIIETLDADYEDITSLNKLDVTNTLRCEKHLKNCALQNVFKIFNWWTNHHKDSPKHFLE